MGRPGKCILHKSREADLDIELLKKYRGKVEPRPYNYDCFEKYLGENFDYKERTMDCFELFLFKENYKASYFDAIGFSPISFLILENPKSERLYSTHHGSKEIYVTIEKESGFFYTDSWMLHEELFIARGVTQEDIKNENKKFLEYLFYLDKHENGRAHIGPQAE